MQFPYRIAAVAIIVSLIFLIQFLWRTPPEEEDRESKILRLLATLETHVTEYEAAIRSLRSEMALARVDAYPNNGNGVTVKDGKKYIDTPSLLNRNRLKIVTMFAALPHLLDYDDALTPALAMGKERDGVSIVIGIPTVKRPTQSYLLPTLQNLINSMLPEEKNDTLIIVFIAEPDVSFVQNTVNSITRQFRKDVETGLIEIIAPSANYYPDFKSMKGTLGDSEERTRWRTKQNLDYAYLMMYAQNRGTYFVQLENDVLSKKGFVTTMKASRVKMRVLDHQKKRANEQDGRHVT